MWLIWTNYYRNSSGMAGWSNRERARMGVGIDLLVGIVGSVLGGWIFGLLGLGAYGLIGRLVMS